MKRYLKVAVAASLMGALLFPATALAKVTKVDVCHSEGNGTFHLITVAEPAYQAHVDHGDSAPGGAVPGMDGYSFDDDCEPVADSVMVLARAWSADASGDDHLIAQLEDTDGSGDVSVGDTVRLFEYPLDFDPTAFGTYGDTVHPVQIVNTSTSTVVSVNSDADVFIWVTPDLQNQEYFAAQGPGGAAFFLDVLDDSGATDEFAQAQAGSPGSPSQAIVLSRTTNRLIDDPHVNVEIN